MFGGFVAGAAAGLKVRHDHGSQFMSDAFQAEIRFLGDLFSGLRSPAGRMLRRALHAHTQKTVAVAAQQSRRTVSGAAGL